MLGIVRFIPTAGNPNGIGCGAESQVIGNYSDTDCLAGLIALVMAQAADECAIPIVDAGKCAHSLTTRTLEKAKERRIPFATENRMHILDTNRLFKSDPCILVMPDCNRHAATLGRNRQRGQPQHLPALEHELALFR